MRHVVSLAALTIFILSYLSASAPPTNYFFQLLPYDFRANFLKPYLITTDKTEYTSDEIKLASAYYMYCRFPNNLACYHEHILSFLRKRDINKQLSFISKPIPLPNQNSADYFNVVLLNSVLTNNRSMAQIALSLGANIEYIYPSYQRPLCHAAECGYTPMVELLLEHGADPNPYKATRKASPLLCALNGNTRNTNAIVKLLLDAGAEQNLSDAQGQTALSFISSHPHFTNARAARELLEKYRQIKHSKIS